SCTILFFFFSSRRRHTRWPRDWSSDVCSSDLQLLKLEVLEAEAFSPRPPGPYPAGPPGRWRGHGRPLLEAYFKLMTDPRLFRDVHHVHLEPRPPLVVPLRRHDQDQSAVELDFELPQVGPHGRLTHPLTAQPRHRSRHAAQLLELEGAHASFSARSCEMAVSGMRSA